MADGEEFRCFVGGLSWDTDNKELESAFERYGRIKEAKVVLDRDTGRPRGFGFVTFEDEQAMEDAIEKMNGKELDGRTISVTKAQPKGEGGGGRRGFGGERRGGSGGGGGSDTCFKCGKSGHWARDCPSSGGGGGGSRSSRDGGYDNGGRYERRSNRYDDYGSGGRSRDGGGSRSSNRPGPYDRDRSRY